MRKWIFIFSDLSHVSTKSRYGSGCICFQGSLIYMERQVSAAHGEL